MTAPAPSCSDCAYVRERSLHGAKVETCGVARLPRIATVLSRMEDAPCGPDAKLFAKREGK